VNGAVHRVWRRVIESGSTFRGFDSSSESTWLPVVAGFRLPDDRGGEARSKLLAVAALASWLAMPPSLDAGSLASVDQMLRGVHECRALLGELAKMLEVLHAEAGDGDE
jgi:hypothetical protein